MALSHSPKVVTDGLVLYLDAANPKSYPGSGTTWYDLSGNENNGTIYNAPTFNVEKSFSFNGLDQYVGIPYTDTDLDGDPDFTVEFLVKRTTDFVSKGFWGIGGSGQAYSIEGWTPTTNLIHLDLYDSTRLASTEYYPLNEYVHVVWSKNGPYIETTNVHCYVNSTESSLTKTRSVTANPRYNTSTTGISIGRININSSNYHTPITISFFKVYNRALSDEEVKQNFNALRGRFGI